MCDTLVATGGSTASGATLFGKNSDRQRNEAQAIEHVAAADHSPGELVRCTYICIPQVSHTNAMLLSRPFWMWGAEMGVNEHGVAIGNEALHARCAAPETPALLGMDLLRLTLERASSAAEAVTVLTTLLECHGQGGNGGHLTPTYYQNGFLIADRLEAFVVETVGRQWLVESVRGVRSMSNRYSIGGDVLRMSAGLSTLIRDCGWGEVPPVSYAETITNPNREHIGNAAARQARSTALLQHRAGTLRPADLMAILRDHGTAQSQQSEWHPECMDTRTVCMHAGSKQRPGQTVGSMVCELSSGQAVHWVTGTAAACLSIFKPVLLDVPLPLPGATPAGAFDPKTLWWRHERLHRLALLRGLGSFTSEIRAQRDALEAGFQTRIRNVLNGGSPADRAHVVASCWHDAAAAEEGWLARAESSAAVSAEPYIPEWRLLSDIAGLELPQAVG